MYNIVFLEIHRQRGLNFFYGQQFRICSLKYATFYIVKKTDVGMYDIMLGRGWLCIIERGRLFDIHGLYGGCVGLYHYYNGNLRATYTYIMIII